MRIGVLASGHGTNLEAILEAQEAGTVSCRTVWVGSSRPGCEALARAARRGIPTVAVDPAGFASRDAFETELASRLTQIGAVDLVVLAGYLRIAGPVLRDAFPRMINLHPSLLPALRGLGSIRRAFEAGLPQTGCTVHVVDAGLDTGPILGQRAVPIHPDDTLETLEARMHATEHALLIDTLRSLSLGRLAPWDWVWASKDAGPVPDS